jgi:hypothetical protein
MTADPSPEGAVKVNVLVDGFRTSDALIVARFVESSHAVACRNHCPTPAPLTSPPETDADAATSCGVELPLIRHAGFGMDLDLPQRYAAAMGLTTCAACSGQVSSEAKACPRCGQPIKPGVSAARLILTTIVLLIVLWMLYGAVTTLIART